MARLQIVIPDKLDVKLRKKLAKMGKSKKGAISKLVETLIADWVDGK